MRWKITTGLALFNIGLGLATSWVVALLSVGTMLVLAGMYDMGQEETDRRGP